jgi:putative ABC transport system permease protein
MLRGLPGVIAATRMSQIPLSGSGSATGRKAAGSEIDTITAPYYTVGEAAVRALGVEIAAGRDFIESDYPLKEDEDEEITLRNVIVTRALSDKLYPDGDGLGKQIQNSDGTSIDTIVGIIGRMQGSWPTSTVAEDVMLYPSRPGTERRVHLVARAEPSAVSALYTGIEEKLLALNQGRLLDVQTLREIKNDTYQSSVGLIKLIGAVVFLLFAVTALGIVGLTSFSVTQRFRQIGTRRALGATRLAILRYFLVENWIITGMGLGIGVALSFLVNWMLVTVADAPKLEWGLLGSSMVFFWLVGLAAALAPAMRSMKISPVIATRTV